MILTNVYSSSVPSCPMCHQRFEAAFCPRDGTRLVADPADVLLGERYRLVRKVGEGSMGEVYQAEHVTIGRKVAVKLLRRDLTSNAAAVARLQREAQSTSGLDHPNIIDTLDFGQAPDGRAYLVMEWVDGATLDHVIEHEMLDVATTLDLGRQMADGVSQAHTRGIIHRDLKPSNMIVTRNRHGARELKVLDFGIAKLAAGSSELTGTGVVIGTPNYMAPEQAFGERVDERSDIYAVGVILYEMLTGSVPFVADSPLAVMHQHTTRMPVLPSAAVPERRLSAAIDDLVMTCLAKPPADRFQTMRELATALAKVDAKAGASQSAAQPAGRALPPPVDEVEDLPKRSRRPIVFVALAMLVIGAAVVAFVVMSPTERTPTPADAAVAIVSGVDAIPLDATTADAPVDARTIAWHHEQRGKHFTVTASVGPRRPIAGHVFELAFVVTDAAHADEPIPSGLSASVTLTSNLSLEHHHVVHSKTHLIEDGTTTSSVLVLKPDRYRVTIEITSHGKRLDLVGFELPVE